MQEYESKTAPLKGYYQKRASCARWTAWVPRTRSRGASSRPWERSARASTDRWQAASRSRRATRSPGCARRRDRLRGPRRADEGGGAGRHHWELDELAERETLTRRAPSRRFKGYLRVSRVLCASVNEEVVHGIPSKTRKLVEGDLMKLDFGVIYQGYYGDSARTVPVGKVSPRGRGAVGGDPRVAGQGHRGDEARQPDRRHRRGGAEPT